MKLSPITGRKGGLTMTWNLSVPVKVWAPRLIMASWMSVFCFRLAFCMYTISRQHQSRSSLYWPCIGPLFSNDQPLVGSKFNLYGAIEKAGSFTVYLTKFSRKRGKIPFQPVPLRVTSLFQPSHCIQPFLGVSNCSYFCICKGYTYCIFPGEPTKLGSKKSVCCLVLFFFSYLLQKVKKFIHSIKFRWSSVVILATLSHSQSESRISNTWSLSTN